MSLRVYLYGKGEKPGVTEAARELEGVLDARDDIELVGTDLSFGKDFSGVDADLMVALGGDGTVLYLARHLFGRQVPVLSVNVGRLGFLAEVALPEVPAVVDSFIRKEAHVSRRMMLDCQVLDAGGGRRTWFRALNDAVVSRGGGRMITLEISCESGPVVAYSGDGVIVSTPTGSTAYGFSAGGPILDAELQALAVVPVCPHSLSTRPVVLDGSETVSVRLCGDTDRAQFTVDGQEGSELVHGETLEVTRAPEPLLLVTVGKNRFQTIREKLDWFADTRLQGEGDG